MGWDEHTRTLAEQLAAAQKEAEQHLDSLLRARADLDNVRKRVAREIEDVRQHANGRLIDGLLPLRDNLERALNAAGEHADADALRTGIELAVRDFDKVLRDFGVETIDPPQGTPFDPEQHEALGVETQTELAPNTVSQLVQKGYRLNGRLIRPAQVMVSKRPLDGPH